MVYYERAAPEQSCGRLSWIWGVYALAMAWLWNGLTAIGLPSPFIWLLAAAAGCCVLICTRAF